MRSLLASSIDDRSGAMQWRPTPQTQREPNRGRSRGTVGEEDAKDAPRVQSPRRRDCPKTPNSVARQPRDSASLSTIYRRGTILDSYTPSQYGPRGFGVGAAIGWLLDRWLGTSPCGMIVFLLLGFAAGVLHVTRAAGVVANNPLD